jgi:hypothetical protein
MRYRITVNVESFYVDVPDDLTEDAIDAYLTEKVGYEMALPKYDFDAVSE